MTQKRTSIMRLPFLALLLVTLGLPAFARPLTEAEAKALESAVARYGRATMAKEAEKVVGTIPPRVLNVVAGTAGIEAKKVTETLVAQTKEVMKTTKISEFVTAPGPWEGNDATLADGTAVVWAVVPAQFVAEGGGRKTLNQQPLLAIEEEGKWYFSRIDGPAQLQIVGFAYPFVAGLDLPPATSVPAN
jgi:hypothetical protein